MSRSAPSLRRTSWTLFRILAREEWRLHTRLFGGWRFVFFPVVVAVLAGLGGVALLANGTARSTVVAGLHVLALGFGLYSGTAGFVGSDMLENVFGDLSLVLSSSTTLPIGRRHLLALFLLKDALFYGIVFVLPMAIGAGPVLGLTAATPLSVLALWLSLSIVFAAGMAVTVALIACRTRGVPAWAIVAAIGGAVVVAWLTDQTSVISAVLVPLGSPAIGGALAIKTLVVATAALAAYDPTYGRPARTAGDRFARTSDVVPFTADPLVRKTLLDLARSSGGVWKPVVSAGILLALVAALVGVVDSITGVEPAPGIFFGGVLGLSAFTTYNWLTQFDAVESYLAYPVSVADVFQAKRVAFVLVGGPAVAGPYLAAVVWFEATIVDAAVGAILLAGYAVYYYGLTVFLAGFDPNEFLFDAVRFSLFTVGVAVPLVPTLVVGFVLVPPTLPIGAALALSGVGVGTIGWVLSSRAGPRWERRYRQG
ncbi:hypothetical protein ACFO5R_07770 [Halosolutus amylolyticus]|uniref:ABC-2 type transport system permease protein n=1 Tax=Halosolutus amylolyticus TaxID=2932267 RepID=A0ABD5PN96_9EURY|nr:hypothetical protein [Halosolutus amylolyticus]